jgi:uncharacterized protein
MTLKFLLLLNTDLKFICVQAAKKTFRPNAALLSRWRNKIYSDGTHVSVFALNVDSKYASPAKRGLFMHPFLSAVIGGALIGFSVVLLMHLSGRIAGISGIVGGLLPPGLADDWRLGLAFVAGLLLTPLILNAIAGFNGIGAPTVGFALLIPAGLLIGVGSALGNGCTSGHGICGLARLSPRSAVATVTFMAAAVVTVFVMRHVI